MLMRESAHGWYGKVLPYHHPARREGTLSHVLDEQLCEWFTRRTDCRACVETGALRYFRTAAEPFGRAERASNRRGGVPVPVELGECQGADVQSVR